MAQAVELLPADYWRYHLLANAPESDDANFTWDGFAGSVNKDLVGTFGNFVNRTLTIASRNFGDAVPAGGDLGAVEQELLRDLTVGLESCAANLETLQFRKATTDLRTLWTLGNAYLERKEPWRAIKSDRDDAALTLRVAMNLIVLYSRLSLPFIPSSATQVLDAMKVPVDARTWPTSVELSLLEPGAPFEVPPLLFRKIAPEELDAWRVEFGGTES